jgi:hypothetical protein
LAKDSMIVSGSIVTKGVGLEREYGLNGQNASLTRGGNGGRGGRGTHAGDSNYGTGGSGANCLSGAYNGGRGGKGAAGAGGGICLICKGPYGVNVTGSLDSRGGVSRTNFGSSKIFGVHGRIRTSGTLATGWNDNYGSPLVQHNEFWVHPIG